MEKETKFNPADNFGGKPGPGRPKGVPNKATVALKGAIIAALDDDSHDGPVGYFKWLKMQHPAVYGSLVGKILPTQVEGSGEDGKIVISWSNE